MDFVKKKPFSISFYSNMGQKNFFLDIMNRKEIFLDKKNEVFKK